MVRAEEKRIQSLENRIAELEASGVKDDTESDESEHSDDEKKEGNIGQDESSEEEDVSGEFV